MARKAKNTGKFAPVDERTGNVRVSSKRSRNLTFTVLLLAIVLVLVIILALVLLQLQREGEETVSEGNALRPTPAILNPDLQDAGVGELIYLYFRWNDSQLLLAQAREVSVKVNETPEEAAVQALIDGPQTSSARLTRLLPTDASIIRAEGNDDTFYITFNQALLRSQSVGETLPMENSLRERLRLIAQSIANTVVNVGNYARVQILIDYEDNGYGEPPSSYEFGFSLQDDGVALPPLSYDESVVCNARNSLSQLMGAFQNEDWQKIHNNYLISDSGASALPSIQEFRDEMETMPCRLMDWELVAELTDVPKDEAQYLLDLTYIYPDGRQTRRQNIPVRFYENAGVWKIKESTFLRIATVNED